MEILHAAEYIDRLMEQGNLVPRNPACMVATFLDGTYPGRTHAVYVRHGESSSELRA